MNQYGPSISYDVSRVPVTMTVAASIFEHVDLIFRENYRLGIDHVRQQGDQVVFTFDADVDSEAFLRHLGTTEPEGYGSV